MEFIGQKIKNIRIGMQLKQQAIADAIGISLTAYSNIESGKTENITLQRLQQSANALKVSINPIISTNTTGNNQMINDLQTQLLDTKAELQKAQE